MNILILSPDYPDSKLAKFAFVKQLVTELAVQGHNVQVVAPFSITHNLGFHKRKEVINHGLGQVIVYRPNYLSFSNIRVGKHRLSSWSIGNAFKRGLNMLRIVPDVVYGHFWSTAYNGFKYANKHHLPLFVASGESEIEFICDNLDKIAFCEYVSGVICVSTKNKDESIARHLTKEEKCVIIPNAIDSRLFEKKSKEACREYLGFPKDVFIVSFVGWFIERKGANRVAEAIKKAGGVYSIFIGKGGVEPDCEGILFKGPLPHDELSKYLNAADCFVLPTQAEGCCNAIIEAMACGLPIISSDLPFNWDVLDKTNSILINPDNINEIAEAITTLRDNKNIRESLSRGALIKANNLTIDKRAASIVSFIREKIN